MISPTVGIAIITHNAKRHLHRCLLPILHSPLNLRILVVNSSSNDGTVELAKQLGAEVLVIPRVEFNHGTTREKARRYLETDIVCMLTPDAYLVDEHVLGKLIDPIIKGNAGVAYARQIPHLGADFFEAFPRGFNYPEKSHIRSIEDIHRYGIFTFFCSDSCAAYANVALDDIGGFQSVLLGEDTVAVAKMLRKGHKIAYVAEAEVRHSHRYSLREEFCRSFDIGLARHSYADLLKSPKGDIQRGLNYAYGMMKQLYGEAPHKIPYAFAHLFAKWLGYRIGKSSSNAPQKLKKIFSSQEFYWTSQDFLKSKKG